MKRGRPEIAPIQPGARFGRLTVLSYVGRHGHNHRWAVQCDCGGTNTVLACHLKRGKTVSCGCMVRTHGQSWPPTAEYECWGGLQDRCNNPDNISYANYGGRGIKISESWRDFSQFFADMGPRPSPAHSLDRWPNNDGDYEKTNCRWATRSEQARNRRSSRPITVNGVTKLLVEWSEESGLSPELLRYRLAHDWPENRLLEPAEPRKPFAPRKVAA